MIGRLPRKIITALSFVVLSMTFLTAFTFDDADTSAVESFCLTEKRTEYNKTPKDYLGIYDIKPVSSLVKLPAVVMEEPVFRANSRIGLAPELQEYAYQLCEEQEVDYALFLALMWQESKFEVNAIGVNTNGTRDVGLMQINDINRGWIADQLGVTNLDDPRQNMLAGVSILGGYTNKYDERSALMAYQMGEAGMKRAKSRGVTTTKSAEKILNKKEEFRQILNGENHFAL